MITEHEEAIEPQQAHVQAQAQAHTPALAPVPQQQQPEPPDAAGAPSARAQVSNYLDTPIITSASHEDSQSDSESANAPPGTADSIFRRCSCIGVMPGRACTLCNNTKWMKRCPNCYGVGAVFQNSRSSYEPRKDRCGFCMGRGWIAARREEVAAATSAVPAAKGAAIPPPQTRPRDAKLPGAAPRTTRQNRAGRTS
jgi:hypothetical protein